MRRPRRRAIGTACAIVVATLSLAALRDASGGGDREEKLRKDRERVEKQGFWAYNDLAKGLAEAKESGKPLVVALRCVPCEECVKLDDDLVDTDARLRPLLERFVRVRLVSTNGLDLGTFQFDTDQSFAVFFLRADGTIYGRYGTRSARTAWADDVSVAGLAAALEGALELHAAWPRDQKALAEKRGPTPPFPTPEAYPTLSKYRPTIATEGKIVPTCIHCHMIGDAERARLLERGAMPDDALFPHPHPKAIGLVLDPARRAVVKSVREGSPAAAAGFRAGDEILTMSGQPLLSIADVQWVLHGVPAAGGRVEAQVVRDAKPAAISLALADGWRRADDLSWRASTWSLRRVALGGMRLDRLADDDPARRTVPEARRAAARLKVEHVGQYAPHDRAKRAGLQKGDVILSFDGCADFTRETDVIRFGLEPAQRAREIPVEVQRGTETLVLRIPPP